MASNEGLVLTIHPLPIFGISIEDINLQDAVPDTVISQIKHFVCEHRLVVFRNQGQVSGERQVEITQWFGEVDVRGFEQHHKSPHEGILRVSNDPEEGMCGFGTAGLHVDGTFLKTPNSHSIYHTIETPRDSETVFVPLYEVWAGLSEEQKYRWERLWMVKTYKHVMRYKDKPGYVVHPLVYTHPTNGKKTLCIHQGKTSTFIMDKGLSSQCRASKQETVEICQEIDTALAQHDHKWWYSHKWCEGDFIISDNLAIAHWAAPSTQESKHDIGLRVMHRTIVRGTFRPQKSDDT